MKWTQASEALFLGLDSSTQGLKAVLVDSNLAVVFGAAVNYDAEFPEFKTAGGVHRHEDGLSVTSPPLLWVAALDAIFDRMRREGAPLARVRAVSDSGQQHGSVWFARGARRVLQGLDPRHTLRAQLADVFAVPASPIWMDASTGRECREREQAMGGPQVVADLTGSRAYERFTGNQIAKLARTNPEGYAATERIALVSSFVASLLIGDYAAVDLSDGSGMNLLDIRAKTWAPAALACTAPDLARLLGAPAPSHAVAGPIHRYYVERYGFDAACRVIVGSGDNPCSLAGLRLQAPGDLAISLGTSDTLFGSLVEPRPSGVEGHVFVNPVDPAAYMAMIVRTNGSLTREHVRNVCAGSAWDTFNRALQATAPGNAGNMSIHVLVPEITPPLLKTGVRRWNAAGAPVDAFDDATEIRALIEGQFLSLRIHGERIGLKPAAILATGGASANPAMLRILCDVFGATVHTGELPDSAAMGAAYRACHGHRCAEEGRFVPYAEVVRAAAPFKKAAEPDAAAHAVYNAMLAPFAQRERELDAE